MKVHPLRCCLLIVCSWTRLHPKIKGVYLDKYPPPYESVILLFSSAVITYIIYKRLHIRHFNPYLKDKNVPSEILYEVYLGNYIAKLGKLCMYEIIIVFTGFTFNKISISSTNIFCWAFSFSYICTISNKLIKIMKYFQYQAMCGCRPLKITLFLWIYVM